MPKRKRVFTSSRVRSQRRKVKLRNETEEEREQRLSLNRERLLRCRGNRNAKQQSHKYNLEREAFQYDPTKEYDQHVNIVIGKMDKVCRFCGAKKYKNESPGMCCLHGKVELLPLKKPPSELLKYMKNETPESRHFLENIRRYNSCFQMTSFGATQIEKNVGFNTVFKIQGQIYHQMGSLLPVPNKSPKFLQVYFMGDEQCEADQRDINIAGLRRDIIVTLQRFLHKHNQIVRIFKTALDKMPADNYKVVIRADKRPIGEHERRFNAPQVNEIAVVIVDSEYDRRDIIIQRRSETLQRIAETHRSYDALQYPLIFWQGEDGYHFNIQQVIPNTGALTNRKITSKEFYAHRIMIRSEEYNHILNCRHLFQQFIVDMYAKIETERLLFIRQNQKKLRTDEYIHLRDAIVNDGRIDNVGKMVILPSSFIGSPRHMHEYAEDAMTYVRKYGLLDVCNRVAKTRTTAFS